MLPAIFAWRGAAHLPGRGPRGVESAAMTMPREFEARLTVPFGRLGVRTDGVAVKEIRFMPPGAALAPTSGLAERACRELERYIDDAEYRFGLPLAPEGTDFQKRVWAQIAAIPKGGTRRYGEIARDIASAARAVGQACGSNPIPVIVPCHRVVAAGGLGGFAHQSGGFLIDVKRWLLTHEGVG